MMIESYALTHEGKVRSNNEDNFFLNGKLKILLRTQRKSADGCSRRKRQLFSVCDGMGGEAMGEWASRLAAQELCRCRQNFRQQADLFVQRVNAKICKKITACGKRIGTTFSALSIENGAAQVFNLGDSRVYMQRCGALQQLSCDDTAVQQLVVSGILTKEQAARHPDRHRLSQHLGVFPHELELKLHKSPPIPLQDGDVFLLCSDGLTDMVTDEDICNTLSRSDSVKTLATVLQGLALKNGGKDNVTVLVVRVKIEPGPKRYGGTHGQQSL